MPRQLVTCPECKTDQHVYNGKLCSHRTDGGLTCLGSHEPVRFGRVVPKVTTEDELMTEYAQASVALDKIYEKLSRHFGPLIDAAVTKGDLEEAKKIMTRMPECPARFWQWKKIHKLES